MTNDLPPAPFVVRSGLVIPMRDGCLLRGNLYLPSSAGLAPCIVTMTPYGADAHHERARYFAERGLLYLVVDVRGRGNSDGDFRPLIQEADDGADVIAWAAALPECDGQVAMKGGSYSGYCQWAAMRRRPKALATIVPTASPFPGVDFPMRGNIFYPYLLRWFAYVRGRTPQAQLFGDDTFWARRFEQWAASGRSFAELEPMLGMDVPAFREWIAHPHPDAYWDRYCPSPNDYAAIDIPILTITGQYDDDQAGALAHYRRALSSDAPHFLVIGPWDHAGTGTPSRSIGGVSFGPASLVDLPALHLQWYRWTMRDGTRPGLLSKAVAYYVTGAEEWRHADDLEAVTARHLMLHLGSPDGAQGLARAGTLSASPQAGDPDHFAFDTRDPDGVVGAAERQIAGGALADRALFEALDNRLLVYRTEPFEQDMLIAGFFSLNCWIGIDRPDADLFVTVNDLAPDGSSLKLAGDAMRARYRLDLRTPEPILTSEPLHYAFDGFNFVARVVRAGHRLELVIAPRGQVIEASFTERNFGGGGVVANETAAAGGPLEVSLHHDADHISLLSVPLGYD